MQQTQRLLLCVALLAFTSLRLGAQVISIANARTQAVGTNVTVRGVVTNGTELGRIRYLQDGTAGIAAFPNSASAAGFDGVQLGDSIEVTGTLVQFQNLLEITPITAFTVITSGLPLPAPRLIALSEVNESLESQLVRVECTTFGAAGGTFSSSGTYDISDSDGGQAKIYLRGQHPMIGSSIPTQAVQLTTIVSQFGDYQLLPRTTADLVATPCFFFADRPEQTNLSTSGFTLSWGTNLTASSVLRYGISPTDLSQSVSDPAQTLQHTANLTGLAAGTIYWIQIAATHNNQTIQSDVVPFATVSNSTGAIRVYFNHGIDNQFVGGQQPSGTSFQDCLDAIIGRINSAGQTIDVSIYNVNRDDIITALTAAHNRGVRVRLVAAEATSNPSLDPAPPFPVVYGNNIALMHNKFMVIDAASEDQSWVMSGSMNWTDANMQEDYNNLLFIQDQSLARTYVIEFEEMWGTNAALPNLNNTRFGSSKRDNTPHRFIIGGVAVESYFSPTDDVTARITQTIETANASAEFALLTFTKDEPANAFIARHNSGQVNVRGLIDNVNDNGSEFDFLQQNGVPVAAHTFPGVLHHKYVVIDALQPTSDPTVLTGSHNWSFTAETQNDENTLVIHSSDIARLFRAEWEQRETENPISVRTPLVRDAVFRLVPNPAHDRFNLYLIGDFTANEPLQYDIVDMTGRAAASGRWSGGHVDITALQSGIYVVKIITEDGLIALPLQKF
jgi:phosphatidylserine/phosphatidylglycerophosphate/cardiolipin synthase-like enzyme